MASCPSRDYSFQILPVSCVCYHNAPSGCAYCREHEVAFCKRPDAGDEREALEHPQHQQGAEHERQEEERDHGPVVRKLEVDHQAESGVRAQAEHLGWCRGSWVCETGGRENGFEGIPMMTGGYEGAHTCACTT